MRLGDIRLYPLEIYEDNQLIFDDIAENLPEELKDRTVGTTEFQNGKLRINIKTEEF